MATSLRKCLRDGVRFKRALHQLNDKEYGLFMMTITKTFDRNLMSNLLCSQFFKPRDNHSIIIQMIKIIDNIKQKRKRYKFTNPNNKIKIDRLSIQLISETASYLNQEEYSRFSRCNRSIFIATNTRNTLRSINLTHPMISFESLSISSNTVKNHNKMPLLENYRYLRSLSFTMSNFKMLKLPKNISGQTLCNSLQHIHIDFENDGDMVSFLKVNCINLSQLKSASIINIKPLISQMTFNTLSKKIESVDKAVFHPLNHGPTQGYNLLFPNLRELEFSSMQKNITVGWLKAYGSQLTKLKFSSHLIKGKDISNIKFIKVNTLGLYGFKNVSFLSGILRTTTDLREITLSSAWYNLDMVNIFQQCLDCPKLEVFRILCPLDEFVQNFAGMLQTHYSIINAMSLALEQDHQSKDKLSLYLDAFAAENIDIFMIWLKEIMNAMTHANIKKFELEIKYCDDEYTTNINQSDLKWTVNEYLRHLPMIQASQTNDYAITIVSKCLN